MVEKSDKFDEWMLIHQSFPYQTFVLNRSCRYIRGQMPLIRQNLALTYA